MPGLTPGICHCQVWALSCRVREGRESRLVPHQQRVRGLKSIIVLHSLPWLRHKGIVRLGTLAHMRGHFSQFLHTRVHCLHMYQHLFSRPKSKPAVIMS